jgi:hypothetical protein
MQAEKEKEDKPFRLEVHYFRENIEEVSDNEMVEVDKSSSLYSKYNTSFKRD